MSRWDHIRYNNHEWRPVTEREPSYVPVDLNMVSFEPATEPEFHELMFRKALGMGKTYAEAREYAAHKAATRHSEDF